MDNRKLMVIDDEKGVCDLLEKLFVKHGYDVVTSTDPVEAMQMAEKEQPDAILLDIKMPKVSGVELLPSLIGMKHDVCVVMITAYGDLQTAMEAMQLGAHDYITKPFDLEFIVGLIDAGIEEKSGKS